MILGYHPILLSILIGTLAISGVSFYLFKKFDYKPFLYTCGILGVVLSLVCLFFEPEFMKDRHHASIFFTFNFSLLYLIYIFIMHKNRTKISDKIKHFELFFITIFAYFTDNIFVFGTLWILSFLPLARELKEESQDLKHAVFFWHHLISTICVMIGFSILIFESIQTGYTSKISEIARFSHFTDLNVLIHGMETKIAGFFLIMAAFIRQGLFPFHLWVKSCVDVNPFPLKMSFYLSNLGFVLFYKMVMPLINFEMSTAFHYVGIYAVISSFYLANLAFVQNKMRMSFLYIMLSHFSILFAGLELNSMIGKAGVFYQFISVSTAFTGVFAIIYLCEAYVGVMKSKVYYGLQIKNPYISVLFLVFALSAVALPFSMNFVGEDILFHAIIDRYPLIGLGLIITTAFNGMNVYRLYSHIFGGTKDDFFENKILLTKVQKFGFSVLILTLFLFGIFPETLLEHILHFI